MKKSFVLIVFGFLFSGMLCVSSRAQQPAPVYFAVFEEMVSTADLTAFNKAQQEAVDLWKKHNLDLPIYCYATDDNSFFWVIPVKNMASLDTMFEKTAAYMKKAKDLDGYDGSGFRDLSTTNFSYIRWMPDISLHPDGNFGQNADKKYMKWAFCYLKQGHEKEATDAVKKYVDLYTKNGDNFEWDVYEVMLGNDTPAWVLAMPASDPVTLEQKESELNQKYKKELPDMWVEFAKHVRKIENKTGWFKQKWSINTNL
jgi:hypothetical protein